MCELHALVEKDSWVIYGLYDVNDPRIRYVGYTTNGIVHRLKRHLLDAKVDTSRRVYKWIRYIGYSNVRIRVLEECPKDMEYIDYAERFWIKSFRDAGFDLVNGTDGGKGTKGYVPTDEWRKNHSIKMTGAGNPMYDKEFSAQHRQNISEGLKGKPSWAKGKVFTEEHRSKISRNHANVSGKNNPMYGVPSPNTGKKVSDETRAKMIESARNRDQTGPHVRWHVNRNIKKDGCEFCD